MRTKKTIPILLLMMVVLFVGCQPENNLNDGGENQSVYNGHEYVDLGLPSGTLWATCNVGDGRPEEYGDYFAWGEGWRTPTREEWGELFSNTDKEFSMINDVEGWLFTAPNGNNLFLPCADWLSGEVESRTFYGYYWSSSFMDFFTGPDCAWCFYFDWSSCRIQSVGRSLGLSVRPIHPVE